MLRQVLAEKNKDGRRTNIRAVVEALVEQACEGKTAAIQQVFDRIDGMIQAIPESPLHDLEAITRVMQAEDAHIDAERTCATAAKVPE